MPKKRLVEQVKVYTHVCYMCELYPCRIDKEGICPLKALKITNQNPAKEFVRL